jgi:hypothetical protein
MSSFLREFDTTNGAHVAVLSSAGSESDSNWSEFSGPAGAQPDTTITGPTLDVTATTNFSGDTIDDVTAIAFETTAASIATFAATQFGSGAIASNATITGDTHADKMDVQLASGATFNGSQLQFSNWSVSDKFVIAGSGDHETITGTSVGDIIDMGAYFDATDAINGGSGANTLVLSGNYSVDTIVTPAMLQNVGRMYLTSGNDYALQFNTGVVAAGDTMTIDAANLDTNDILTLNLSNDTMGRYIVDLGDNTLCSVTIGDQADTIVAGTGQDFIYVGGILNHQAKIEGTGHFTNLYLSGDYSAGYAFGASQIAHVSTIFLEGGHSYNLTINNANIAPSDTMTVDASALGSGDSFTFNGSHETNGNLDLNGGAGLDDLTGGAGNDSFQFIGADMLTSADRINGEGGTNEVGLDGDYSHGLALTNATLKNIQSISLADGYSYKLTLAPDAVAAGQTLTVDGAGLGPSDTMDINGSKVTSGTLDMEAGFGNATLVGGSGTDNFYVGDGVDVMTCGIGSDTFYYGQFSSSDSSHYDNIIAFNALTDAFHLEFHSPNAVDPMVTQGVLWSKDFAADLTKALGPNQLHAHDAVLFSPSAGNFVGHTFLIVETAGVAGYEAGSDMVIELTGASNLSQFSIADFA